jgi:methylmalonyl-CoA mutase C-terminal domain/subunit
VRKGSYESVFGGGIVPDEDVAELKKLGVGAIFKPGASTKDIIDWVEANVRPRLEAR